MRFRLFRNVRLSPRTQRRLEAAWGTVRTVVTYPFGLVFALLRAFAGTVAHWWESRNLRFLLQGLPSFFIGIAVVVMAAVIFFQDRGLLANEYRNQGIRSLSEAEQAVRSSKDAKAALAKSQTCYKRLSFLQPDRDEDTFRMAQAYNLQRQPQAALEILKGLAPLPKTPGEKLKSYGPAHLFMAQRVMAQKPLTPAALVTAEQHLLRAVHWKGDQATPQAHFELFRLYRVMNRPADAEQHLVAAVSRLGDRVPEWRLVLAQWYMAQGKKDLATAQAQRTAKALRDRLDDTLDDHNARGMLIECLVFTGDFAAAKEQCMTGATLVPGTDMANRYRLTLAQILVAWYDARKADPKATLDEQFRLLEEAMAINPMDQRLLERLVVYMKQTGAQADKVRDHFRKLIDEGKSSAIAHLVLGMYYWSEGDQPDARHHWEKALDKTQAEPNMGTLLIMNNLAWVYTQFPPVDLDRAIALIDTALKYKPDEPKFHSTRGHILYKLERFKEAAEALEKAKAAYPNDPNLFKLLGELYEKIGLKGEAEHYKRKAEELRKALPAAQGGPPAAPPKGGASGGNPPEATPDPKATAPKP